MRYPLCLSLCLVLCCVFEARASGREDGPTYMDNFAKVCEAPEAASVALAEEAWHTDLEMAMTALLASADRAQVPLERRGRQETIRLGANVADPGRPRDWQRAEAPDGSYWIDVLAYDRTLHAMAFMEQVGQDHSGVMGRIRSTFITINVDSGRDSVAAVIRNERSIINVGCHIPFKVMNPGVGENSAAELAVISEAVDRMAQLLELSRQALVAPAQEQSEADVPVSVEVQRVAGLARIWSEVRYNFVFMDERPGLDWDRAFHEFLPRVEAVENDAEYVELLQEFVALLGDGHTWVYATGDARVATDAPPVRVVPVAGQPVVVDVAEELRSRIEPGMAIASIDGVPIDDFLATEIHPRIFASTTQDRDARSCRRVLAGAPGSEVDVVFERLDGSSEHVTLRRDASEHEDFAARQKRPSFEFRQLPDGAVHVALNTFADRAVVDEFDRHFEQILDASALIIDVRENGGGSTQNAYAILGRLINETATQTSKWRTRIHRPAFHAWGNPVGWYEDVHPAVRPRGSQPFLGPVAVLVGPRTYSAAEDFLIPMQATGRATIVGTPTGGSTGQPLVFDVHAARVGIVSKWDYLPDGSDFVGVGILPDVEVEASRDDVAAGRDVVLERAIEIVHASDETDADEEAEARGHD